MPLPACSLTSNELQHVVLQKCLGDSTEAPSRADQNLNSPSLIEFFLLLDVEFSNARFLVLWNFLLRINENTSALKVFDSVHANGGTPWEKLSGERR